MFDVVNVDERLIEFSNNLNEILKDFRDVLDNPSATKLRFDCRYDQGDVFEGCVVKTTKETGYRDYRFSLVFALKNQDVERADSYEVLAHITEKCEIIIDKVDFWTTEKDVENGLQYMSTERSDFIRGRLAENLLFYIATNYILLNKPNDFDVETKTAKPQSQRHHKKNRKKNNVVRMYKCYTLQRDFEIPRPKPNHKIDCPAWGVRGHYRHYQNGKTVFVPQYVKGKDKTKYQGKEYVLFPQ